MEDVPSAAPSVLLKKTRKTTSMLSFSPLWKPAQLWGFGVEVEEVVEEVVVVVVVLEGL